MSKLTRHLDSLTVEALSPDGRIRAIVEGRSQPRIQFDDPTQFSMYRDTSALSAESETALNRAVSKWRKQHKDAVDKYARANHSGPHWDAGRRRMYAEFEQIQAQGRAPVDLVRVITTGLVSWKVGVRPGALESLSAWVFCTAINAAIQDAARQYYTTMQELKAKALIDLTPKHLRWPRNQELHRLIQKQKATGPMLRPPQATGIERSMPTKSDPPDPIGICSDDSRSSRFGAMPGRRRFRLPSGQDIPANSSNVPIPKSCPVTTTGGKA